MGFKPARTKKLIEPELFTAIVKLQAELTQTKKQRDDLLLACKHAGDAMELDPVLCNGEWQTGMFCGLEDRNITDRYDACIYGYETALNKVQEWIISILDEAIAEVEGK